MLVLLLLFCSLFFPLAKIEQRSLYRGVKALNIAGKRLKLHLKVGVLSTDFLLYGLAFDSSFNQAILEHEIYANALIYDNKYGYAVPNSNNLAAYGRRRFKKSLSWPSEDNQSVYLFKTRAFFTDGKALYPIEREGKNSGYRVIDNWGVDYVGQVIDTSTDYLARQVKKTQENIIMAGSLVLIDRFLPIMRCVMPAQPMP